MVTYYEITLSSYAIINVFVWDISFEAKINYYEECMIQK